MLQAEGNTNGHVVVAQFNGTTDDPPRQPTYTDMMAARRPRKGLVEPAFQAVRLETSGYSLSDSGSGNPSSGYPPSNSITTYPPTNTSSASVASSSVSSRAPSSKSGRDVVNAPSVRTAASDAEEAVYFPSNESEVNLVPLPGSSRREVDGGIRVAGGRVSRESWFNNLRGGTLPLAYDEY